jgi:hypothetical protein
MRGVIVRLFFETDSVIVPDIGIVLVFFSDDLEFILAIIKGLLKCSHTFYK